MSRSAASAPLPLLLAARHLKSARKNAFSSFLSIVAVGGMTLGVAALVLSLAALSGFQGELKREILSRTPEIAIDVPDRQAAERMIESSWRQRGVEEVQLTRSGLGWMLVSNGIEAVEMVGFEGDLPVQFGGASDTGAGLYLPESLAREWLLDVGDVIEIASGYPTLTPLGPQPRVRRLPLHGTYASGKIEHRVRIALPLADAEALLGGGYRVLVATGELSRAELVAAELAVGLPESAVIRTWKDLNRALFFALRLEKAVMFLGVVLIVFVAALALVSNLSLIIADKRREVGMLLAMGMAPGRLRQSFFILGCGLACAGITTGALLGSAGARLLDSYRLLRLPQSVYFLDYVPFLVVPAEVAVVLMAAAVVAVAATVYAARGLVRLDPVEALRR